MLPHMRRSLSTFRGPGRRQSGQALVETAIIMPIVIFLVLGALQLVLIQHARIMTEYAAYNAARAGVVCEATVDALDQALRSTLLESKQNPDRGAKGKALVERLFSPSAVGAQLEDMYEAVRSARRTPPG